MAQLDEIPIHADKSLLLSLLQAEDWLAAEDIKIPTLLQLAQEDCNQLSQIACVEFQRLLCAVVRGYLSCLRELGEEFKCYKEIAGQHNYDLAIQLQGLAALTDITWNVSHYAAYLKKLAYSDLIESHFEILSLIFHKEWILYQQARKNHPDMESSDSESETDNEFGNAKLSGLCSAIETKPSGPDISTTLLQWLRLQVKHQVAVDCLMSIQLPRALSIEVIDSAIQGNTMEYWQKTIRDLASCWNVGDLDQIITKLTTVMPATQPPAFPQTLHCEAILATDPIQSR
jgi:hypothetical protein